MSVYYDAAAVLDGESQGGSLKSRIYDNKSGLGSKPAHLYALISETAKYDNFLKEIIDQADFLGQEPKLTPTLCLLLVHDFLFAKAGIAASSSHHLRQAIERHKARLRAELTKARLRRKCATLEQLKQQLLSERAPSGTIQPRWIRVNTLKSSLEEQLATTFKEYRTDATIDEVLAAQSTSKILALDRDIPGLMAVPPDANITKTRAYADGAIILQDKASCFPAYLLVGDLLGSKEVGGCIDGCAAPGNKTSHLASLCSTNRSRNITIYACEKDERRSRTLSSMMERAGASNVTVLQKQDFLATDPKDSNYAGVTHLLLDPSCSGSGIIGREDIPTLNLPLDPKARRGKGNGAQKVSQKRKRDPANEVGNTTERLTEETKDTTYDPARLQRLAILQAKIVQHALAFPAATRVTYSTCSIHVEENEAVVSRILHSPIAKARGWRVLRRQDQVKSLRDWEHRGVEPTTTGSEYLDGTGKSPPLSEEEREACIRCVPGDKHGTMGFFLCGFVRASEPLPAAVASNTLGTDAEGWEGFND